MNEDDNFEELSPKAIPVKKKQKNPFQAVIPEITSINQKAILIGTVILGTIGCFVFYEFISSSFDIEKPKEENENTIIKTAANDLISGPKSYEELRTLNKSDLDQNQLPVKSNKSNPTADQNYHNSPPIPAQQIPSPNPPAIPLPNYNSPLQFSTISGQTQQVYSSAGESENMDMPDFRKSVRNNKDFYNSATITEPISPYEIKAGAIIPAALITGINSDLPGVMIAQITENVFDTVSGRYLLLPQGTKLIGQYNTEITYGQDRVQVIWSRLIMPNGDSLDLNGAVGADTSGYSGLKGKTNNHDNRLVNGALATSAFAVLVGTQTKSTSDSNSDPATIVSQNMSQIADKIISRGMEAKPTIEIEPGARFNILVDQDLLLRPYRSL